MNAAHSLDATAPAKPAADVASHHVPAGRSPQPLPLMELTQVLDLIMPPGCGGGAVASTAPGVPEHRQRGEEPSEPPAAGLSAASKLMVGTALRTQWPDTTKKVPLADAVAVCREAAALLHEAAERLLRGAAQLDDCADSAREFKRPATSATEPKRRRTFGGSSPTGVSSPSRDGGVADGGTSAAAIDVGSNGGASLAGHGAAGLGIGPSGPASGSRSRCAGLRV